jgi:hypothetical protein
LCAASALSATASGLIDSPVLFSLCLCSRRCCLFLELAACLLSRLSIPSDHGCYAAAGPLVHIRQDSGAGSGTLSVSFRQLLPWLLSHHCHILAVRFLLCFCFFTLCRDAGEVRVSFRSSLPVALRCRA